MSDKEKKEVVVDSGAPITGGEFDFPQLTNKLSPRDYAIAKVNIWLMIVRSFKAPTKWQKPNAKGTKVLFTVIRNEEEGAIAIDQLEIFAKSVNKKFDLGFKIQRTENVKVDAE